MNYTSDKDQKKEAVEVTADVTTLKDDLEVNGMNAEFINLRTTGWVQVSFTFIQILPLNISLIGNSADSQSPNRFGCAVNRKYVNVTRLCPWNCCSRLHRLFDNVFKRDNFKLCAGTSRDRHS